MARRIFSVALYAVACVAVGLSLAFEGPGIWNLTMMALIFATAWMAVALEGWKRG